ncbi:MAG: ABC transporter ATP-binding protein [Rhodobacteraceae bacterium]|nr:ABC transporter ATP-binding protein [Paracoccaceae bacterium]
MSLLTMFGRTKTRQPLFNADDRDALKWFWNTYLKSRTPWLLVVFAMIFVQGLIYQQFLSLTESGLRVVFDSGAFAELARICAIVFGVFMLRGILSYVVPRISETLAADAVYRLRCDMVAKYLSLDLSYFDRTNTGDVILRLVQQAEGLSRFIGQTTVNALRDGATVIVVSGYLLYKQPILFLVTLAVVPGILFAIQRVSDRIKVIQANAETALGQYMTGIEEMTNGMRTIKMSGQEEMEESRLEKTNDGIRHLTVNLQLAQALVLTFLDFAAALAYVLVIGGGGYMVLSPDFDMDGAAMIAFLLGLVLVFDPGRNLSKFFVTLQASLVLFKSIRRLFLEQAQIYDRPGATSDFDPQGDIVLDKASFEYHEGSPVLRSLDMEFKGGQVTSIVGPTGSGKTTILSLLGRLYEPNDGTVTIGGKDISDIKIKDLRKSFSVVAQDIVVFNKSIIENIRYVRPDATDEEVAAAAEAAELSALIAERGDVPVGPKGAQLSGGQKQRIAIARAFLQDAPIVILDEATSALDQRTEERIKSALNRLSKNRTTIMVAHRLSSVISSDRIYVLESGAIAEYGTHEELMANEALYYNMFVSQQGAYNKDQAAG